MATAPPSPARVPRRPGVAAPVVAVAALLAALVAAHPWTPRIRVACVGDSITEGRDIPDPERRYPARLQALLGERYEVRNLGVGGATALSTGDLPYRRQPAFARALAFRPDVVVVGLGSNDAKPGNRAGMGAFAEDLGALVETFRSVNPAARVILLRPPPVVGEGRFGIREEVVAGEVAPLIARVARETGVEMIDLHALLTGRPDLLPDQVHPDAEGADRIARAVADAIRR